MRLVWIFILISLARATKQSESMVMVGSENGWVRIRAERTRWLVMWGWRIPKYRGWLVHQPSGDYLQLPHSTAEVAVPAKKAES